MTLPAEFNRDQLAEIDKQGLIDLLEVLYTRMHQLETQVQEQATTICYCSLAWIVTFSQS